MANTWTAWLDYIPIVGTVQESVDCIGALCHGDTILAAQKGASAALGGLLNSLTGPGGVTPVINNLKLKGVDKDAVSRLIQAAKVAWPDKQFEPALNDRVDIIMQHIAEKEGAGEKKRKLKRGQHVINTGVLRVFEEIIDSYREDRRPITEDTPATFRAYYHPLPEMRDTIQAMLVDIDTEYVDCNATMYRIFIEDLRRLVVCYMRLLRDHPNDHDAKDKAHKKIIAAVCRINDGEVYVDPIARGIWLREGAPGEDRMRTYLLAKNSVKDMFQSLVDHPEQIEQWIIDLRQPI